MTKKTITAVSVLAVAAALCIAVVSGRVWSSPSRSAGGERLQWVEVDDAVSGHKVELDSGEDLVYAGIRSFYPHEPLHDEARRRNAELVEGQVLRLRFDADQRDRKGRLVAYASVDSTMVNEILVREGLAYARLTPGTRRFADRLLAAQTEARREKRGVWRHTFRSHRRGHPADPKYGNVHDPDCEQAGRIKPERVVVFKNIDDALEQGFAPCPKCLVAGQ